MSPAAVRRAHAKLTMSLHVTGVRADGYHLIDAEMVSLELHDLLTFDDLPGLEVRLDASGPFADGMPLDGSNLVARALELADRGARVTIDKRIPHGGGLGGGSTDAATALRWAGYGASPDRCTPGQLSTAASLGADIPFCLVGGRARVTGIGEVVEPLPHVERPITLIIPPLHVNTPAVYRAWDELGRGEQSGDRNDLEAAALVVEPQLARWRDEILRHTGVAPTLAGSGATWFLEGHVTAGSGASGSSPELTELAARGATIVRTHTVDTGRATG
jgi:4-diphosphocytidyl-2-C-methyl-D-erythritol kinase